MYKILSSVIIISLLFCLIFGYRGSENMQLQLLSDVSPKNESSKLEKLIKLGIITVDDIEENEYITVMEGLRILYRIANASTPLSFWYQLSETEHLDYLEEWDKSVLTSLWAESVLLKEEFILIDLDSCLTEYEALVYITRLLGNTYGCVQFKDETTFTSIEQTYTVAFEKALITESSMAKSNDFLRKNEYLSLIYNALYAENIRGNIAGVHNFRYIDSFSNRKYDINDEVVRNKGVADNSNAYHEKIEYLTLILVSEYEGISANNSIVLIQGEELSPGIYTRFHGKWVPESITLAKGEMFQKGTYYLLTSYEHRYRKEEYNSLAFYLFQAGETSNILHNIREPGDKLYHINIQGQPSKGIVYTSEIHIQKIHVEGNAADGFTIYLTPESSGIFEVIEGSAPTS